MASAGEPAAGHGAIGDRDAAPETAAETAVETGPASGGRLSALRRRRRANVAGGRRHAHQVKVTPEEEALLLVRAGEQGVSVARLMVESALADHGETASQRREVLTELLVLHRLVSNIANNVNQLAKVANASGDVRPETVHYLREARSLVGRIDATLDDVAGGRP